jgi:hypothetical protein
MTIHMITHALPNIDRDTRYFAYHRSRTCNVTCIHLILTFDVSETLTLLTLTQPR